MSKPANEIAFAPSVHLDAEPRVLPASDLPIEEPPLLRSKRWLTTAGLILEAYGALLEAGDVKGSRVALKEYRESLRTAEDCAYEASR